MAHHHQGHCAEECAREHGRADGEGSAKQLAHAIYRQGRKNVTAGPNPHACQAFDEAVNARATELVNMAKPVTGPMIAQVGIIFSANHDETIGRIIAEAMEKVGKHGVITVEEARSMDPSFEVVERMQFGRGYLSPILLTDPERMRSRAGDPVILIHEKADQRPRRPAAVLGAGIPRCSRTAGQASQLRKSSQTPRQHPSLRSVC